jgi:hypothetical protein
MPPWAAREQRPGTSCGWVSAQDDIWAAGRLIFYMSTREELTDRSQIEDRPALRNLLAEVFGPPEGRPTARDLLRRLNEDCPVPRALDSHSWLNAGRQSFYAVRASKHPGIAADAGDGASPGRPAGPIWEPPGRPAAAPDAVIPQVPPRDSDAAGRPRSSRGLLWRSR